MLCCIKAAAVVTTGPKLSFMLARSSPGGHILLQSNVFVQFAELMRRYKLPLPHPCVTPYPQYFCPFSESVGDLQMAASSSVREPPRRAAPITLSCHANGPLMVHAGDLGKLLPAVPN